MTLTFYHAPNSTSNVTEAVLAELGTPCETIQLDIPSGETKTPDFLAVNPNGRVPAIVHHGTAIWESAAITLYLGETFGVDAQLFPAPGPRRGEAMKWIVWTNTTLADAGGRLAAALPPGAPGGVEPGSRDWVPGDLRDARVAEQARTDLTRFLGVLEAGLEQRLFLLGAYSLADTHVQSFVGWLRTLGVGLGPFPKITAWLGRCEDRPALAALRGE